MSPVVLGIDTSGSWCSAALVGAGAHRVRRAEVGNAHSTHLLPMIGELLAEASVTLNECTAIAFSAGPGSFTGLRVGCAVAQGLAFGAGLPVAAIGTLEAIAHSALAHSPIGPPDDAPRTMLAAQDARMGEVYWAWLTYDAGRLATAAGPELCAPRRLRENLAAHDLTGRAEIGCGNAWTIHGAPLDGLVMRVVERSSADALDVALLGVSAARDGRLTDAAVASPIYVRDRVALTTAERAARTRDAVAPEVAS